MIEGNFTPLTKDLANNKILAQQVKSREVGYKKPPIEHQFKPGQSGNPDGRPKKKTIIEMVDEKLEELMPGANKTGHEMLAETIVRFLLGSKDSTTGKIFRADKQVIKDFIQQRDGMPKQSTDITSGGKPLPNPIYGGKSTE